MTKIYIKDISPEVLKKAVFENSLINKPVLTILSIGLIGGLGTLMFSSVLLSAAVLGGGLLTSGALFSFNYWGRRDELEQKYLEDLNAQVLAKQKQKLADFEKEIRHCLKFSNNDKYVKQTHKQFQSICEKFSSFQKILSKKFDPNELTFSRFYTTADQTYGAVLDNLEDVVNSFLALKDIDLDYLEEKYVELKKQIDSGTAEKFDVEEFKAIQDRIDLRENKFAEIDEILSKNEKAITELDNLSFKLSSTKTYEGRAKQDLEKTLEDLIALINSVSKYKVQ